MVVITVDRYIAVCLPGEVQLRTVRRARYAVAYVTVLSVVRSACLTLLTSGKGLYRLVPRTLVGQLYIPELTVRLPNPQKR